MHIPRLTPRHNSIKVNLCKLQSPKSTETLSDFVGSVNSLMARIEDLPVELLEAVFRCLRYTIPLYEKEPSCKPASQVCAHWRAVALSTPELWTLIPLKSKRWTKLCLSRSVPATISVDAEWLRNADYETRRATWPVVCNELHRVSSLRLSSNTIANPALFMHTTPHILSAVLWEFFEGLNSGPALNLSNLFISFDDKDTQISPRYPSSFDDSDDDRSLGLPAELPLSIFSCEKLDALRTASFKACLVPLLWSQTFIPSNLHSLTLVDSLAWQDVDGMVQFFQLVPGLATLDLQLPRTWRACVFNTTPSLVHHSRSVSLPAMRNLRIKAPFFEGLTMLIHLALPATTSIDLTVCDKNRNTVLASINADAILQLGKKAIHDHFSTAVAEGRGYRHIGFYEKRLSGPCTADIAKILRLDPAPEEFVPPVSSVHLSFGISAGRSLYQSDSYALYLAQPMFNGAECMSFVTFPAREAWPLFHHFAVLHDLYLCDRSFAAFATALLEVPIESRMFPALRRVQVTDLFIDWEEEAQENTEDQIAQVQASVQRCLGAVGRLAQYEDFEMLVLAGHVHVSHGTSETISDILGPARITYNREM